MNKMEESFLRLCLHPKVECDLPGRLRISFSKYHLLPKEALPYLHYIQDVLQLLPGVSGAEINPRIGTVLIRYDAAVTNTRAISALGGYRGRRGHLHFRKKTSGRTPSEKRRWKRSSVSG